MEKELKKENRLIDLIEDRLDDNEKKLMESIDFGKSIDENIRVLIKRDVLNFKDY